MGSREEGAGGASAEGECHEQESWGPAWASGQPAAVLQRIGSWAYTLVFCVLRTL